MQDLPVIPEPYLDFFDSVSLEHRPLEVYGCNEVSCMYHLARSGPSAVLYEFEDKNASYRGYPVKKVSSAKRYISFLKEKSYIKAVNDGVHLKNYCPDEYFMQSFKSSAEKIRIDDLSVIMSNYEYVSFDFFGTLVEEKSSLQKRLKDYCAFSEHEAKEFSFTLDFTVQSLKKNPNRKHYRLTDHIVEMPTNMRIFNQVQVGKIILSDCLENIRENYLELTGSPLYILSCDAGLTKANGGLYSKLPSNCVHFGDNFLVDGLMANYNMVDSLIFDNEGYYFSKCTS